MVDVVCVGAHPDDVEIGMGGTVAALVADGLRVAVVDLTDGEPTPAGSAEIRRAESEKAAHVLGVTTRRTLELPNRELFDSVVARQALAEVFRELAPRIVFSPYPLDAHPDHVAAATIVRGARFYSKFTKSEMRGDPHYPARVYCYMAVHMRLVRYPAFVFDISGHLDTKVEALSAYRSQFVDNPANSRVIESVVRVSRAWGAMIGSDAGEPFFTEEPVGVASLRALV